MIANKANALKSGVKTDKGKSKIRFNARKHGILGKLITDYEENIYQFYLDQVFEEYEPKTFIEEMLVERIALSYLRLFRAGKAEQEFITYKLNFETLNLGLGGKECQINDSAIEYLYKIYMRYENRIENRMYKAIHELERQQRRRKGEYVEAPLSVDINKQ